MAFALGLSPFGRSSAAEIPLESLVAFQSFRLPLELVMRRAGTLGIMPVELSYSGYNVDIVTGAGVVVVFDPGDSGSRLSENALLVRGQLAFGHPGRPLQPPKTASTKSCPRPRGAVDYGAAHSTTPRTARHVSSAPPARTRRRYEIPLPDLR